MEPTTLSASGQAEQPVWLSGELLTMLSKVVFPTVWLATLMGVVISGFHNADRIQITSGFGLVALLVVIATGFLIRMTFGLQRVGYVAGQLIVSNYSRDVRIPFEEIEAVEPVWWFRPRMVIIRFRNKTRFGRAIYYLPKWSTIGSAEPMPEQQLRDLLTQAGVLT